MNILLVDDDAEDRFILLDYLCELMPSSIFEMAENGKEALVKLQTFRAELIFSDINMPIMGGYEFVESALLAGCTARFIMLSTNACEKERCDLRNLDFVCKAFSGLNTMQLRKFIFAGTGVKSN